MKVGDKKITDTEGILNEEVKFYRKLYTSNCKSDDQIKRYISSARPDYVLNEKEKSLCEGLLKESECTDVVFQMKKNKSPGSDGVEFYQAFWPDVKSLVIKSLNEGYIKGQLS